jgi:hypothetical protein
LQVSLASIMLSSTSRILTGSVSVSVFKDLP